MPVSRQVHTRVLTVRHSSPFHRCDVLHERQLGRRSSKDGRASAARRHEPICNWAYALVPTIDGARSDGDDQRQHRIPKRKGKYCVARDNLILGQARARARDARWRQRKGAAPNDDVPLFQIPTRVHDGSTSVEKTPNSSERDSFKARAAYLHTELRSRHGSRRARVLLPAHLHSRATL